MLKQVTLSLAGILVLTAGGCASLTEQEVRDLPQEKLEYYNNISPLDLDGLDSQSSFLVHKEINRRAREKEIKQRQERYAAERAQIEEAKEQKAKERAAEEAKYTYVTWEDLAGKEVPQPVDKALWNQILYDFRYDIRRADKVTHTFYEYGLKLEIVASFKKSFGGWYYRCVTFKHPLPGWGATGDSLELDVSGFDDQQFLNLTAGWQEILSSCRPGTGKFYRVLKSEVP